MLDTNMFDNLGSAWRDFSEREVFPNVKLIGCRILLIGNVLIDSFRELIIIILENSLIQVLSSFSCYHYIFPGVCCHMVQPEPPVSPDVGSCMFPCYLSEPVWACVSLCEPVCLCLTIWVPAGGMRSWLWSDRYQRVGDSTAGYDIPLSLLSFPRTVLGLGGLRNPWARDERMMMSPTDLLSVITRSGLASPQLERPSLQK